MEQEETAVARQKCCKHVSAIINANLVSITSDNIFFAIYYINLIFLFSVMYDYVNKNIYFLAACANALMEVLFCLLYVYVCFLLLLVWN
jgi:hypothetical protein